MPSPHCGLKGPSQHDSHSDIQPPGLSHQHFLSFSSLGAVCSSALQPSPEAFCSAPHIIIWVSGSCLQCLPGPRSLGGRCLSCLREQALCVLSCSHAVCSSESAPKRFVWLVVLLEALSECLLLPGSLSVYPQLRLASRQCSPPRPPAVHQLLGRSGCHGWPAEFQSPLSGAECHSVYCVDTPGAGFCGCSVLGQSRSRQETAPKMITYCINFLIKIFFWKHSHVLPFHSDYFLCLYQQGLKSSFILLTTSWLVGQVVGSLLQDAMSCRSVTARVP